MEFPFPKNARPDAQPQPRCLSYSRYVPIIWAEDLFEYLESLEYLTNKNDLEDAEGKDLNFF